MKNWLRCVSLLEQWPGVVGVILFVVPAVVLVAITLAFVHIAPCVASSAP